MKKKLFIFICILLVLITFAGCYQRYIIPVPAGGGNGGDTTPAFSETQKKEAANSIAEKIADPDFIAAATSVAGTNGLKTTP